MHEKQHPGGGKIKVLDKSVRTIRFMLVTASKLLQEGFTSVIRHLDGRELACVDGLGAFLAHCDHAGPPDVLVVEPAMVDAVRARMQDRGWRCRVLMLWARPHSSQVHLTHASRLCGLLRICMGGGELDDLVQDVARCRYSDASSCGNWQDCTVRETMQQPPTPLSRRELDVFRQLGHGKSVRHIAHHLSVSVKTVESHRENIKRKLELDGAAALLEAAILWRRGEHVAANGREVGAAFGITSGDRCLDDGDTLRLDMDV